MQGLIAYDADGNVVGTLDHMVARNDAGQIVGFIDFEVHEAAGGQMTDIWIHPKAVGSGTWPEWLGMAAHRFTVELDDRKRIRALVHKTSGHRRERAAIEAAIAAVPVTDGVRDIRQLVGGPTAPLALDDAGRTLPPAHLGSPSHLPLVRR